MRTGIILAANRHGSKTTKMAITAKLNARKLEAPTNTLCASVLHVPFHVNTETVSVVIMFAVPVIALKPELHKCVNMMILHKVHVVVLTESNSIGIF